MSSAEREMEIHNLPQSAVFAIAAEEDCLVLEVAPDLMVGQSHWISSTFLLRKRRRAAPLGRGSRYAAKVCQPQERTRSLLRLRRGIVEDPLVACACRPKVFAGLEQLGQQEVRLDV